MVRGGLHVKRTPSETKRAEAEEGDSPEIGNDTVEKSMTDDSDDPDGDHNDDYPLGEDVYSLIFLAPFGSHEFLFAVYMIILKFLLFAFLAIDLHDQTGGQLEWAEPLIRLTQFFLLPVAIALQEDLIHVFTRVANIRYTRDILELAPHATEKKWALSFLLRFMDGMSSLIVNFVVLLTTDQVLSIFLNFAALQFLQSIDDVAFQLAADGYLGDKMEDTCQLVRKCSLKRRVGDKFTNSLDSVLFATTLVVMLSIYIYVIKYTNDNRVIAEVAL